MKKHSEIKQYDGDPINIVASTNGEETPKAKKPSRVRQLDKFLNGFPDDTDMWIDATDELMDVAREVREKVNEINHVSEGDEGYIEAIDFRQFRNPGKRNKTYKAQIRELWPKLTTQMKEEILQDIRAMKL